MTLPNISVFEHDSLRVGQQSLSPDQLEALRRFHGEGTPYYSLIHNGIKFNKHVGVIQVGQTVIEVLPKVDKDDNPDTWRDVLIFMLQAVDFFEIHAPSSSDLRLKTNSILDLYFEIFISKLEYLLRRGLVKKYRRTEGNKTTLKGSIQFAKHISQNLVHQERFYVRYSSYDKEHDIHAILYKALKLLSQINTNVQLSGRLGALLLDFPEIYDMKISETLFARINTALDRKTEPYRDALAIARLILLNYHPDISRGPNNVLALMFDMNLLWERFVYVSLRKHKEKGTTITAQNTRDFWKPVSGYRSRMRPDIVLNKDRENCMVLDTKWKNLNRANPSPEDLRQMFVYMKYYKTKKVALVYPGPEDHIQRGQYYDHVTAGSKELSDEECSVISVGVKEKIKSWQKKISQSISNVNGDPDEVSDHED
ncbi:MAG: McrC family protein [Gammaproteobacteria bacterium]